MKLDTRLPALVVLGTWNPAIFQPAWVARHLFGVPEGQSIQGWEMVTSNQPPKHVTYLGQVGYSITQTRLEVYSNTGLAEAFGEAEKFAIQVIEKLPHTPLGAFGINQRFFEEHPDADLLEKLRTNDRVREQGTVTKEQFSTVYELAEGAYLRLLREVSSDGVMIDFNYHHPSVSFETRETRIMGALGRYYAQSIKWIYQLYDLEVDGVLMHEFPVGEEGRQ
jgi:hypothetical protein